MFRVQQHTLLSVWGKLQMAAANRVCNGITTAKPWIALGLGRRKTKVGLSGCISPVVCAVDLSISTSSAQPGPGNTAVQHPRKAPTTSPRRLQGSQPALPCDVLRSPQQYRTATTTKSRALHAQRMQPTGPTSLREQRRSLQDAQKASKIRAHMSKAAAELVLVRHGETDWNSEHRLQGQLSPGPPLNALGQQQAKALAQALAGQQFHALYSSDLLRTLQTAQAVAERLKLQVLAQPELRERHLGCLQGLTYAQCPLQQPAAWQALRSPDSSTCVPGGGESLDGMRQRVVGALEALAAEHPGQRLLVVTHGGVLRCVHCHARGHSPPGSIFNGALVTVVIEGSCRPWAMLGWNETGYMEAAGCAPVGNGFGGGRADG